MIRARDRTGWLDCRPGPRATGTLDGLEQHRPGPSQAELEQTAGTPAQPRKMPARQLECQPSLISRPDRWSSSPALLFRPGLPYAGRDSCMPAQNLLYRPDNITSRPTLAYVGPDCCLYSFKYSCIVNPIYIMYIRHNTRVLWYTRGYIPDISPRGCGGLAESCTGFNKNIPKSQTCILMKPICWPALAKFYLMPS
jgi:hypothetical protein